MPTISEKKEAVKRAKEIHGDSFSYRLRRKSFVDLTKLKNNQSVCAAGMKGYHILLTEK